MRVAFVALLLVPFCAFAQAQGQGIGVAGRVEVHDAQRGQSYHATLDVQNSDATASTITITKSGETGPWAATDPADGFELAAHGHRSVDVTLAVPNDAPNGLHAGQLTFTSKAKGTVTGGPGSNTSPGVGIRMNVTVGGTATTLLTWMDARAEDVDVGTPMRVLASLRNDGNVRSTGTAEALVRALGSDAVVARGTLSLEVEPGATREAAFRFDTTLPLGQYRAHVTSTEPAGFERDLEFVVHPPGVVPKHGNLLALHHAATIEVGRPLKIVAEFRNVGNQSIAQAKPVLEIYNGADLVAALSGDARVVEAGTTGNLSVFWTPAQAGTFRIVAKVAYDGYETTPVESHVGVRSATLTLLGNPFVWGGALFALVSIILFLILRRRKKRTRPGTTPPDVTSAMEGSDAPIVPPIPPRKPPPV